MKHKTQFQQVGTERNVHENLIKTCSMKQDQIHEEERGNERLCTTNAAASDNIRSGLGIKLRAERGKLKCENVNLETVAETHIPWDTVNQGPQMYSVP